MNLTLALTLMTLSGAAPKFQAFDSKVDGFHIDFPGTPKLEISKDKGIVTRTWTVDDDHAVYWVEVMSEPSVVPEDAKDLLDGFRKAEKENGELTSDKPVMLGALKGLELKSKGKEIDSMMRMFVIKGRTYTVTIDADHPHSFAELGADQFFSSFTIGGNAAPAPASKSPAAAPAKDLSSDGVELVGWTPDGTRVVYIEHGIYDGKGTPWARVTFFDTSKNAPMSKPLELELDGESTRVAAVEEARKRAEVERVRLKLPTLVPGKVIKTDGKGELTAADGTPIGSLGITSSRAGKKQRVRECPEGFSAELLNAKLYLMGGDEPIKVLDERKTPASRACSMGCKPTSTYGQGKGALFVLSCAVQGFEGADNQSLVLPLGKLEFPLESDLPPQ